MTVPKETIWPLDPHTLAKHEILRRYLEAWFPIVGRYSHRIVYIDGFAGPGRYAGGEPTTFQRPSRERPLPRGAR